VNGATTNPLLNCVQNLSLSVNSNLLVLSLLITDLLITDYSPNAGPTTFGTEKGAFASLPAD
jgi:hypothetical protein